MDDGYALIFGSLYQAGSWNHDGNIYTSSVPAVFRSKDNGLTWQRDALSTEPGCIYSLAVHPENHDVLYAGGNTRPNNQDSQIALFRSTNGGVKWEDIGPSIGSLWNSIQAVIIDPFEPDRMIFGTERGEIYSSDNGGEDWIECHDFFDPVHCIFADPVLEDVLYIGTDNGMFFSENGGQDFEEISDGLITKQVNCIAYDDVEGVLYLGTDSGVYRCQTGTDVDERDESVEPADVTLYQNYPNPFNAFTEIQYRLERNRAVNISIFDVTGRRIRTLVDDDQTAGMKKVVWNGKDALGLDASSGIYIIKIKTDQRLLTKKMILQR